MKTTKFYAATVMFALSAAMLGCNLTSSSADDDSAFATKADLAALKAQLRTQVVQLRPAMSQSAARTMAFGGVPNAVPSAVTVSAPIGTSCGFDGTMLTATHECVIDSQGAFVILPYPSGASNSYQAVYPVLFANADCTGQAYIGLGPQTINAVPASGAFVFRVDPNNLGTSDASTYFHLSAGATSALVQPSSISNRDGDCEPSGLSAPGGFTPITAGVAGTWGAAPIGIYSAGTPQ